MEVTAGRLSIGGPLVFLAYLSSLTSPIRSLIGHLVEHAPADVLRAHVSRCGGHLVRIAPRLADRDGSHRCSAVTTSRTGT